MLKIHYGELEAENYIFNPDAFFNNTYEDEWITDPFSVQMIKDIDGSDVKGARAIDSPFLGLIPTERLSGGVKTLILMNNDSEHILTLLHVVIIALNGYLKSVRRRNCSFVSATSWILGNNLSILRSKIWV